MRRFRSIRSKLGPPWLVELGDSGKVSHTLAGICDAFLERLRLGLEARFPSRAGDSALALLGRDRLLPRGRRERAESYADRLKQWRYPCGHRVRGSAFALLDQVAAYLGSVLTAVVEGGITTYVPASPPVSTVDASGTVFARDRFGGQTVTRGGSWTWDSQPATNWSRFWLQVDARGLATPCPDSEDPAFWANEDQAYGFDVLTASDAQALRDLVSGRGAWKPAGTRPEWLIVAFAGSAPEPDATWATWAKYVDGLGYDQIEPSRSGDYRYISLSPEQNNTYAGDPDRYPIVFAVLGLDGPDGLTPYGDSSSYPSTIAMPDDSTYAGNPATFPSPIQMIDDGAPVP